MVSRIETISDPSRTIVSYDDVAPAYDADRFGPRPGRYDFQETSVLVNILLADLLADRSGWRALDVACGTGKIAVTAARAGGKVVACDASVPMLQRCEANARKADVKGVLRAAAADAARLPFPDNVFDIVFSFRFLHLFPIETDITFVREMARVVKPGGFVVVEVCNPVFASAIRPVKRLLHVLQGKRPDNYGSARGLKHLRYVAERTGCLQLMFRRGLTLPKGWWLLEQPRLLEVARRLAHRPLKWLCQQHLAIYRKTEQARVQGALL